MKTPQVLEELEKQMTPHGLDEKSKDRYVEILWEWLEGADGQKAQTAARILGKGFIGEVVSVEPLEVLPIRDYDKGVAQMLGTVEEQVEREKEEQERRERELS